MKQRKSIQLPGFRKGKAPQAMVERQFGEGVFFEDALELVYPEAVMSAIEEAKLKTVGQPFELEVPVMSKSEGVEMKMKVMFILKLNLLHTKVLRLLKSQVKQQTKMLKMNLKICRTEIQDL